MKSQALSLRVVSLAALFLSFSASSFAAEWNAQVSCNNGTDSEWLRIDQHESKSRFQAVFKGQAAKDLKEAGVNGTRPGAPGEVIIDPLFADRHGLRMERYEIAYTADGGVVLYYKDRNDNNRNYRFHGCNWKF